MRRRLPALARARDSACYIPSVPMPSHPLSRLSLPAFALLVAAAGCSKAPSSSGSPTAETAKATPTPATPAAAADPARPAGPMILGEKVTAAPVALADVAKDPKAFEGKPLATTGTVTAVCQHMGCWMEIADASSQAHIRMHGHSFFIPKSASGRHARVQATIVPAEDAKECDDDKKAGAAAALAKVELDATGVELD